MKTKNHKPRNTNTNPATDQPNQTQMQQTQTQQLIFLVNQTQKQQTPMDFWNLILCSYFVFLSSLRARNSSNRCQIPNISKCSAVSCFGCNILLQLLLSPSNSCLSYKNWKEISIRKNITFNLKSNLKRK